MFGSYPWQGVQRKAEYSQELTLYVDYQSVILLPVLYDDVSRVLTRLTSRRIRKILPFSVV